MCLLELGDKAFHEAVVRCVKAREGRAPVLLADKGVGRVLVEKEGEEGLPEPRVVKEQRQRVLYLPDAPLSLSHEKYLCRYGPRRAERLYYGQRRRDALCPVIHYAALLRRPGYLADHQFVNLVEEELRELLACPRVKGRGIGPRVAL